MKNFNQKLASTVWCVLLVALLSLHAAKAQETVSEEFSGSYFSAAVVLGHAHVFKGYDAEGNRSVLFLPSWGIDVNYHFHPKWAVSLQTDLIIGVFDVEEMHGSSGSSTVLERSNPIAPALMGIYNLNAHWNVLLGAGVEFAKEGNLFLNRAAVEYEVQLPKRFVLLSTLSYDIKWNAYDSWILSLGIAKEF